MNPLAELLKKLLSDVVAFSIKTQKYHWNVEGPDFTQYHSFFADLYGEVNGSVDSIAELIRTLDVKSPGSLKEFLEMSSIDEDVDPVDALSMVRDLLAENDKLLAVLYIVYKAAEDASEFGISNFLQDRIQAHEKHRWMLRAITK